MAKKTATSPKRQIKNADETPKIYELEVFIIDGPLSPSFLKKFRVVARTILIRGDQTLQHLHEAIFDAFGRFDEHMYEFQFGNGPMDPHGTRYVLSVVADDPIGEEDGMKIGGAVERTTIDSLGLKVGDPFGYWFDFGDDWWHQINVEGIESREPEGKYPRLIKQEGDNPPQYPDLEEEEAEAEAPKPKRKPKTPRKPAANKASTPTEAASNARKNAGDAESTAEAKTSAKPEVAKASPTAKTTKGASKPKASTTTTSAKSKTSPGKAAKKAK